MTVGMRASREKQIKDKNWLYRSIFDSVTDGIILVDLETGSILDANLAACSMHGYTPEEFIGLLPKDIIHPDSMDIFSKYLTEFRSGGILDTQALHMYQDGSTFNIEWRGTGFSYEDKPCLLGVLRDVSQRIQAEGQLKRHIEIRTREQAILLDISHTLASTLELDPGLILDQLWEIIEYTHAGLFALSDSTLTALAVRDSTSSNTGSGFPGSGDFTNGLVDDRVSKHGLTGSNQNHPFKVHLDGPETLAALFNGHQPIRIPDVRSKNPSAVFLRSLLVGEAAFLLEGISSWMWVPLAVKGNIIGGLGVAHFQKNYFTTHHANLALSMADQVAITMVNAELYEQARTLAAMQERQRLARNLHDAVNQSLFSAGLIAEVLPRLWQRDQAQAQESLEDLRRLTRGALAEMRELLAELRPSVLTDSSLDDLLRQLANAFTGRTNITVSINSASNLTLPSEIQVVFYRICQEALNNIAKHAGASHVQIDLQFEAGRKQDGEDAESLAPSLISISPGSGAIKPVKLIISDDGLGFDPVVNSTPGHYGLTMMRERAESIDGQLTFVSRPGHGTQVTLTWPNPLKKEVM